MCVCHVYVLIKAWSEQVSPTSASVGCVSYVCCVLCDIRSFQLLLYSCCSAKTIPLSFVRTLISDDSVDNDAHLSE